MRKISIVSMLAIFAIIAASCGSSNNVVNNRLISKRKYTKGFFINKKANLKTDKEKAENIAFDDTKVKNEVAKKNGFRKANRNSESTSIHANVASSNVVSVETVENENSNAFEEEYASSWSEDRNVPAGDDGLVSEPTRGSAETNVSQATALEKDQGDWKEESSLSALSGTAMTVLLVILAIIIPPLAVFIYEGASTRFWIDLLLAILGYGLGFGLLGGIWGILGLVAVIYALLIVLEVI